MWYCMKLMKVSWLDRVINEKVLNHVNTKRTILSNNKKSYRITGHVLQHIGLAQLTIKGIDKEKRATGTPRYMCIEQIVKDRYGQI